MEIISNDFICNDHKLGTFLLRRAEISTIFEENQPKKKKRNKFSILITLYILRKKNVKFNSKFVNNNRKRVVE